MSSTPLATVAVCVTLTLTPELVARLRQQRVRQAEVQVAAESMSRALFGG